jgi:large subunit ribosomal protein L17
MRHLNAHRKLGRDSAHRKSLLRNLCTSLILHERIETTLPKAKELRPFAEKVITLGRRGLKAELPADAVHLRRQASAFFHAGNRTGPNRRPDGGYKRPRPARTAGVAAVDKLFDELATRFADRPGGYTRIIKLGTRRGDGAEVAIIELLGSEGKRVVKAKESKPEESADRAKKGGLLDRLRRRRKGDEGEGEAAE